MAAGLRERTLCDYLMARWDDAFEWGRTDCCAFAAGWVRIDTGMDPMARWWGRYADANTARAAMGIGGLRRAFVAGCRSAGLILVEPTQDGDVGLVATTDGPAAAIRWKGHWLGKVDGGMGYHSSAVLAMGRR